ncbi:hypothetical protein OJF2_34690 [Aquisphaera giovannonii]|uniref:Uncharacterized protein n=1 Tax=Aquisphaera giovannonii TaxID=406548 RepID=A0A5B9W3U6_9BACT|nr:hypothetical protein [Aquisphaera giovannonii]QEH34924.1 hypothetical protein OJF2_34690 [Aquisphaera giovannonii]
MARSVPEDIASIPHWARVAFAARCSRNVLPLFERFWPDAEPRRREPLLSATRLAERSAQEGRPAPGLKDAIVGSVTTAGAALLPTYGMSSGDEPLPAGEHACHVASFAAKSAEWAANAAREAPSGSADAALEAYTWARDAAHAAEAVDVLARLRGDFAGLVRVATRGRWADDTPVPPSLFELLAEDSDEKPWWAFWR